MKNVATYEKIPTIWSAHAVLRGQQRGIRKPEVDIVFYQGDREVPAGSNCCRLAISGHKLKSLVEAGSIAPDLAEKCKRLILLTDGLSIITTYRAPRLQ